MNSFQAGVRNENFEQVVTRTIEEKKVQITHS